MRLLLDSHILTWAIFRNVEIKPDALAMIEDSGSSVFYSPVSLYEIEYKRSLGRWDIPPVEEWLDKLALSGASPVLILPEHMIDAARLPNHHRDPWDCVLIAQARIERLTLLSQDSHFQNYDVDLVQA